MICSVDRVQFDGNKLIGFEFYNIDKELKLKNYVEQKTTCLEQLSQFDEFYKIAYSLIKKDVLVITGDNRKTMTLSDFSSWFCKKNKSAGQNKRVYSKPLGIANPENAAGGDRYVQDLLSDLNNNEGYDFSVDDNGLSLATLALKDEHTLGFDFDLFSTKCGVVFEFLKRDSEYVNNLTAHPARYPKNKHKFVSLWKAAKKINPHNPSLYLINYSDNHCEDISVIKVIDFCVCFKTENENKMTLSDIGYKLESGRSELLHLLTRFQECCIQGQKCLDSKKKEIRNTDFWNAYYNFEKHKRPKIGVNYT